MGKVKQLPYQIRNEERHMIMTFFLTHVRTCAGGSLSVMDIYNTYNKWREDMGFNKSALSVHGFGRLVPKNFDRKHLKRSGNKTVRSLMHVTWLNG